MSKYLNSQHPLLQLMPELWHHQHSYRKPLFLKWPYKLMPRHSPHVSSIFRRELLSMSSQERLLQLDSALAAHFSWYVGFPALWALESKAQDHRALLQLFQRLKRQSIHDFLARHSHTDLDHPWMETAKEHLVPMWRCFWRESLQLPPRQSRRQFSRSSQSTRSIVESMEQFSLAGCRNHRQSFPSRSTLCPCPDFCQPRYTGRFGLDRKTSRP